MPATGSCSGNAMGKEFKRKISQNTRWRWRVGGAILLIGVAALFLLHFQSVAEPPLLKVAFLDIGQGDAIYVESPSGYTMLIDGGPDSSLLTELGKVMPFYRKMIDVLVVTNPDKDHIAGFIDVLDSYRVGLVVEPGTRSTSAIYTALKDVITESMRTHGTQTMVARRGDRIDLGGGAELIILFPDRDVSSWSTNDGSILAKLVYASTSVMFTGDAPQKSERYLANLENADFDLAADILKVGHHGSKTSTATAFIEKVRPAIAVISAGFKNRYGHPHPLTLETLKKFGAETLITFEKGTILFRSNGKLWLEPEFIQ